MMKNRKIALSSAVVISGSMIAGCSAAPGTANSGGGAERTGVIVAELASVPSDVRCVQIYGYGPSYINSTTDVTPGGSAKVHIGSLNPGSYELYGSAYSSSCDAIYTADGGTSQSWAPTQRPCSSRRASTRTPPFTSTALARSTWASASIAAPTRAIARFARAQATVGL